MKHTQRSIYSNMEFNVTEMMRSTEQTQGVVINGPMVWFSRRLLCHHTGLFMLAELENEYGAINRRTTSGEQNHTAVAAASYKVRNDVSHRIKHNSEALKISHLIIDQPDCINTCRQS